MATVSNDRVHRPVKPKPPNVPPAPQPPCPAAGPIVRIQAWIGGVLHKGVLVPAEPAPRDLPRAGEHVARRPGYHGDDHDGDPLRPPVDESVPCSSCWGTCTEPANPDARCTGCGGIGVEPLPTPEELEAMLAGASPADPVTVEEVDRMCGGLVEIVPDDQAPPF